MTPDSEKRRQDLLQLARSARREREVRQWLSSPLGERLRRFFASPWAQRERQRLQLLNEAELELQREEAKSQQPKDIESAPVPSEAELRDANGNRVRKAVETIYAPFAPGTGPSVVDVVPLVKEHLKSSGYKASKRRIQDIAAEPQFDGKRRPQGQRRD